MTLSPAAEERWPKSANYIFDAATACFERHGVGRTTMDDIAREAGVSRAAIYYHFPNKQALVTAVVVRERGPSTNRSEFSLPGARADCRPWSRPSPRRSKRPWGTHTQRCSQGRAQGS